MHTARIPPVEVAPAAMTIVLATHAGHICLSSFRRLLETWQSIARFKICYRIGDDFRCGKPFLLIIIRSCCNIANLLRLKRSRDYFLTVSQPGAE